MKTYHTLITCDADGKWSPQFGDFDRKVVMQEAKDAQRKGGSQPLRVADIQIVTSGPDQKEIDAAVKLYNRNHRRLTKFELPVAAAVFACSNMGLSIPDIAMVRKMMGQGNWRKEPWDIESAIAQVCGHYAENDMHLTIFEAEGKRWVRELKQRSINYINRVHPDLASILDLLEGSQ